MQNMLEAGADKVSINSAAVNNPKLIEDCAKEFGSQCVVLAMDVKKHLQEKVFDTMIPRNVRVSEAPSFGMPAIIYDRRSKGSQAYLQLADEILRKTNSKEAA